MRMRRVAGRRSLTLVVTAALCTLGATLAAIPAQAATDLGSILAGPPDSTYTLIPDAETTASLHLGTLTASQVADGWAGSTAEVVAEGFTNGLQRAWQTAASVYSVEVDEFSTPTGALDHLTKARDRTATTFKNYQGDIDTLSIPNSYGFQAASSSGEKQIQIFFAKGIHCYDLGFYASAVVDKRVALAQASRQYALAPSATGTVTQPPRSSSSSFSSSSSSSRSSSTNSSAASSSSSAPIAAAPAASSGGGGNTGLVAAIVAATVLIVGGLVAFVLLSRRRPARAAAAAAPGVPPWGAQPPWPPGPPPPSGPWQPTGPGQPPGAPWPPPAAPAPPGPAPYAPRPVYASPYAPTPLPPGPGAQRPVPAPSIPSALPPGPAPQSTPTMFIPPQSADPAGPPASSSPASDTAPLPTFSPDRSHWWDGAAWQDAARTRPPGSQLSPDGRAWWDGTGWRPTSG